MLYLFTNSEKVTHHKPSRRLVGETLTPLRRFPVKKSAKRTAKKAKKMVRKGGAKLWSAAEIARLKTMYKSQSTTQIARQLRRTLSSVRSKVVALSLRKTPARKAAPRMGRRRR
jgi:hypothetical protein